VRASNAGIYGQDAVINNRICYERLQEYGGFISRVDYQRSITIAKWPYSGFTAKFAVGVPVKGADISIGYQIFLITEEERISG
jgi:hypothetical protein